MASSNIEKRLQALESDVAELKNRLAGGQTSTTPWWKEVWGAFRGDPAFLEAMELGRKYRESLRPKAKRRKPQATRSKRRHGGT